MIEYAVKCNNLLKRYPMYKGDYERLKGLLFPGYKPDEFVALKGIDLEIPKGQIMGLIGLNGSGKSTLSSIIAGITYADAGDLTVNGDVSMLSASAGLDNYLTGCLLYTSDAADDKPSVDLGGRRIIKKIFFKQKTAYEIPLRLVGSEMCIRDSYHPILILSSVLIPFFSYGIPIILFYHDLYQLSLIHI